MSVCVSLSRRIQSRRNDQIQNNFQHFLNYFHIFKHWSGSAIRSLFGWWLSQKYVTFTASTNANALTMKFILILLRTTRTHIFIFRFRKSLFFSFPLKRTTAHTHTIVIVITLQMYSTFYEFQLPYHHRHHIACGQHQVFLLNPTPTFA